jgi:tetratricopeptide (TPR) repeat protein
MATLCLNMIVKNESKIIIRLLESVVRLIDSYCICDTGSTDDTIEIIESFFKEKGIPGKIVKEPFRDFGYNRTFSLKACQDMPYADYILLLDADMIFWVDPAINKDQFKEILAKGDAHYIFQGSENFYYKNVRIVKNRLGITYWGCTHEYVNLPANTKYNMIQKDMVFIKDIGDGGSKADKFLRDIELLKKGLEEYPNNDRYTFYLANSYRDSQQFDLAIETFKKRIDIGGWIEEVWHSYYSIGNCYKYKNDMPNAIHWWMEAYQHYPERLENLYEIIRYYRTASKYKLAYPFYTLAKNELDKKRKLEYLFMQKDIYDYKLDYEMSIIGYYCNTDKHDLIGLSMKVLAYPNLDKSTATNVLANYKFYSKKLVDVASNPDKELIHTLKSIGLSSNIPSYFVSSSPSIISLSEKEYLVCVRYVNYKIGAKGEYINGDTIETINVLANITKDDTGIWKKTGERLLRHDTSHDNVYIGLEDVRLFHINNTVLYNANRGLNRGSIVIETGQIDETSGNLLNSSFLQIDGQREVEKNWVYFTDSVGKAKMIYNWSPLIIGDVEQGQFTKTHSIETPYFFKFLRGSTNGQTIDGDIWFICHVVSYEDRRYYYHLVVVLDATTFKVKKYTPLFTFEGKKVEYTLGFTYSKESDDLLIGYSVMDSRTEYISVPKQSIQSGNLRFPEPLP